MQMTTCQVCGRHVKTSAKGKIAKHGYNQPDRHLGSYRTIDCNGGGYLAYEVSRQRLADIIEFHRQQGSTVPANIIERFNAWTGEGA
jgi:hypothetical protein